MAWFPQTDNVRHRPIGWPDAVLLTFLAAILAALLLGGRGAVGPASHLSRPIDLSPWALPADALRSLFRIFVAFFFSVIFSIGYGYVAAKSPAARRFMVPLLDILQSVPVLGFLAATMTFFISLFPGSTLGFEIAAVFAIFTAQAWNLTFAFYHSLLTLPKDLEEATRVLRLSPWQRLGHFEVPSAMIPMVLNAMMSFGGSWFFLAASESFTFHRKTVQLAGVGSYIAAAQTRGDTGAMLLALLTLVILIVAVDQLFWRPVIAWAHKFKLEQVPSEGPPSFVLTVLRRSALVQVLEERVLGPLLEKVDHLLRSRAQRPPRRRAPLRTLLLWGVGGLALAFTVYFLGRGASSVVHAGVQLVPQAFVLGLFTLGRVFASVALGALWTVPVGVAIGMSSRLIKWAQPLAQLAASFPANVLFPFVLAFFLRVHLGLNIGAIPLMMLGTQWYLLFNVMAGALAIPSDMKEAARVFGLKGLGVWRDMILPAIFPSLITGGITAAGGAWNASIVAEVVSWGHNTSAASGLGAMIKIASNNGNNAALLVGILVMSLFVVATNWLVWRPLYRLAETKFHVES